MAFSLKVLISEIEKDTKTFVGWLVKQYSCFYKNEPTLIKTIDGTVAYAKDGLAIVLAVTGQGALEPVISNIVDEVISDLDRGAALVYDFGPSPNAASIFAAVQANLASLTDMGHIKDPVTIAKMKLIINAIGVVAQLIAKAVAAAATPAAVKPPTA